MENSKIIQCPKCKTKLKVPYIPGKKLKVRCTKCGYEFETVFNLPRKKNFIDDTIFYLKDLWGYIKRFFQDIKYKYERYKHDPIYREELERKGTITLIILGALFLIDIILGILIR